jgi:hypothetical protein
MRGPRVLQQTDICLSIFDKIKITRVLIGLFGPVRQEVAYHRMKLLTDDFHNLCRPIIHQTLPVDPVVRVTWAGRVLSIGKLRNAYSTQTRR